MKNTNNLYEESALTARLQLEFLDYLDDEYFKGNNNARQVIDDFFKRKPYSFEKTRPFANLQSTLALLTPTLFFLRQKAFENKSLDIEVNVEYKLNGKKQPCLNPKDLFRILRNTIAHIFEGTGRIYTEDNHLIIFENTYRSNQHEIIIFTTESFHKFVIDCARILPKLL